MEISQNRISNVLISLKLTLSAGSNVLFPRNPINLSLLLSRTLPIKPNAKDIPHKTSPNHNPKSIDPVALSKAGSLRSFATLPSLDILIVRPKAREISYPANQLEMIVD
jgi:hypothetical protein